MRIAMISDCYAPRLGGIETLVKDLSRQLAAAGHRVAVFTATPAGTTRGYARDDADIFPVHRLTARLPWELPVIPHARQRLRHALAAAQPDVVHVHAGIACPFAWAGIAAAQDVHLPVLVTWHCTLGRTGAGLLAATGAVQRWEARGALLSAVSRFAGQWVTRAGARDPVRVVPNGIDVARWVGERRRRSQKEPVRFVSAIRLVAAKRPHVLVAAFAEALRQVPTVRAQLTLCGSGPRAAALERQIAAAGMDGLVELRGRVSRDELVQLYADSDVYLSARLDEAFGIAPLEGRTAGLAVVGRAGTGMDDFITHGCHGLLAASDAELATHIATLLAQPDLLARIQEHNRATPPREAWPAVISLVEDAYREAGCRVGKVL